MVTLLDRRKELGLTQTQMAKEFGVCLRTYQNWEYGLVKLPGPAIKVFETLQKRTDLIDKKVGNFHGN